MSLIFGGNSALEATAYHEAGHAVVAIHLHVPIENGMITIESKEDNEAGRFEAKKKKKIVLGQFSVVADETDEFREEHEILRLMA